MGASAGRGVESTDPMSSSPEESAPGSGRFGTRLGAKGLPMARQLVMPPRQLAIAVVRNATKDFQVKINGFRVELNEVEAVVTQANKDVSMAIASVYNKRLVMYGQQ